MFCLYDDNKKLIQNLSVSINIIHQYISVESPNMSVEFETKQLDFNNPIENQPTKKRKRKMKYSELMKSAMTSDRTEEDITKAHEERLKHALGGGQFSKIDKI